jgi:hypothetical protein
MKFRQGVIVPDRAGFDAEIGVALVCARLVFADTPFGRKRFPSGFVRTTPDKPGRG